MYKVFILKAQKIPIFNPLTVVYQLKIAKMTFNPQ